MLLEPQKGDRPNTWGYERNKMLLTSDFSSNKYQIMVFVGI